MDLITLFVLNLSNILVIALKVYLVFWKHVIMFSNSGTCRCKTKLDGKTVIVTGANSGIGLETARNFATRGARVILACRNIKAGFYAKADIIKSTGNTNIVLKHLDISSLNSIRVFARDVNETEYRLDILVHNAGILDGRGKVTEDGLELTLATNYFGPFLLTHLLISLLRKSVQSRVVVVSSIAYKSSTLDLDLLTRQNEAQGSHLLYMYSYTKLLQVYFTVELARRLKSYGVTANCLHPGIVGTGIIRSVLPTYFHWASYIVMRFLGISADRGCQTVVHVAVSRELEKTSGKFFMSCREYGTGLNLNDDVKIWKLWELSRQFSGVTENDPVI